MTRPVFTPPALSPDDPMPVVALGLQAGGGIFRFRDANGAERLLTPDDLLSQPAVIALFGGSTAWMRRNFPAAFLVVAHAPGGGKEVRVGIDYVRLAFYLADLCVTAHEAARPPPARRGVNRIGRWRRMWSRLAGWLRPRVAPPVESL